LTEIDPENEQPFGQATAGIVQLGLMFTPALVVRLIGPLALQLNVCVAADA
jgi:hypothetical protein